MYGEAIVLYLNANYEFSISKLVTLNAVDFFIFHLISSHVYDVERITEMEYLPASPL